MDVGRLRIDGFAFALGALALLTFAFVYTRNGAALIMCGLCFAGLLTARVVGFSNRALVPVALGVVALLWIVWIEQPGDSHQTSALAHGLGGVLAGWAFSEFLRTRLDPPLWLFAAIAGVITLTVLWELGEYVGDRALDTGLIPNKRDSAVDIIVGSGGGALGVTLAWLVLPQRLRR
jgi:hypothetical protein